MNMKKVSSKLGSVAGVTRLVLLAVPCALILSTLTACTNKPPGCADPKVIELAKQIVEESIVKKADPNGLSRIQVALSIVTEAGYNGDVGKWSCSGQANLQTTPEVLKAVSEEIKMIQTVTHPDADQAAAIALYRMAGKKFLTDEEQGLAFALEARAWKPYAQEELKAAMTFTSQFEAGGSKNLAVEVRGGSVEFNQFPQLARLAVERQQREAKAAPATSAQSSPQPAPATATDQPLKIQVAKAEMCGPEALCITDATGVTYTGNAFAIADADRASVLEAAKRQGTVCLKGVSVPDKTFDSAEKC
ncbi:hypothetical protein [Caenimonas aquaedulcis]|uniref:Lipoprotein n=1 Tax=Caenimonas aquaedulcis TaxID=2793270 RepID=A0A931H4B3_9BURK|nr:hypothetical protein [Caenimonas aquaedulcis]MBG9388371.1 hypothetical protein [Caenimonas aquaedulcis]